MIIKSLLDTDFYKLSIGQLALHQFPQVDVKYKFKCRNDMKWTKKHLARLHEEVESFCELRFTEEELKYLSDIGVFKPSFIDLLRLYQPSIRHLAMEIKDNTLHFTIHGPWFLTVFFEVPMLAIINEIYFDDIDKLSGTWLGWEDFYRDGRRKLYDKIDLANKVGFPFVDFGTRRRHSRNWQSEVVGTLKDNATNFVGTSNVYLAKKYDLKPIGTQAHEIFQVAQAVYPIRDFQKNMLQAWLDEYRGQLGIALTDIIGIDDFLKDFDLYLAKAYNGIRHDSGSPYEFADKIISHYEKLGIDPKTKILVFSDGLNFNKCSGLYNTYKNKINVNFGIGTNLTNNFDGLIPLQIVIKIVECNGQDVAKISDSPGKNMCENLEYVAYLKKVFGVNK